MSPSLRSQHGQLSTGAAAAAALPAALEPERDNEVLPRGNSTLRTAEGERPGQEVALLEAYAWDKAAVFMGMRGIKMAEEGKRADDAFVALSLPAASSVTESVRVYVVEGIGRIRMYCLIIV